MNTRIDWTAVADTSVTDYVARLDKEADRIAGELGIRRRKKRTRKAAAK